MRVGIAFNTKEDTHNPAIEDLYEEFDAPHTIEALSKIFSDLGHTVVKLGFGRVAVQKILEQEIDFVFNIAEGFFGRSREAHMPALFEMLEIPFSGPDPLCAALTLDKILAKKIAQDSNVKTPISGKIDFPVVVKLAFEGSSKGIRLSSLCENQLALDKQIAWLQKNYPGQMILVEKFIPGKEYTVGIIGNHDPEVLGIMEIRPRKTLPEKFIYSLEVKRNYLKEVDYFCPAPMDGKLKEKIEANALKLFKVFGCRDFARFDFRLGPDGDPYFIEVNPIPGLNPVSSDLVIMARLLGIEYASLVKKIIRISFERCGLNYEKV